jgi:exonuclease III
VCALLRPGLAPAAPPRFSLDLDAPAAAHHAEGRVIALEFASLRLLLTYTPNSGATDESRLRRAAFDAQLSAFVAAPHAKPLLWCGDLNVAPDAALDLLPSPSSFPRDLAGTTAAEQTRFRTICAAGGLRDVWRVRNPGARGGMTWRGAAYVRACGRGDACSRARAG